jgi:hypothetical protein
MSRSIAAVFAQPSFPDCTGIVQAKRSLPDRAESKSVAESAASATEQRPGDRRLWETPGPGRRCGRPGRVGRWSVLEGLVEAEEGLGERRGVLEGGEVSDVGEVGLGHVLSDRVHRLVCEWAGAGAD